MSNLLENNSLTLAKAHERVTDTQLMILQERDQQKSFKFLFQVARISSGSEKHWAIALCREGMKKGTIGCGNFQAAYFINPDGTMSEKVPYKNFHIMHDGLCHMF